MGGQADLARAQRPAAPADQGHKGRAVVRGTEGRVAAPAPRRATGARRPSAPGSPSATPRASEAGSRPVQALGQHGLSRSRRPDHQQVVPPGGRHLEGMAAEGLPLHVGQIRRVGRRGTGARGWRWPASRPGPAGSAPSRPAMPRRARRRPGPTRPPGRRTAARPARAVAVASARAIMPGHMAQRAVEAEFAAEGEAARCSPGGVGRWPPAPPRPWPGRARRLPCERLRAPGSP